MQVGDKVRINSPLHFLINNLEGYIEREGLGFDFIVRLEEAWKVLYFLEEVPLNRNELELVYV